MAEYENTASDTWICSCGTANTGKFCVTCGSPRPAAPKPSAEWVCTCGKSNTGNFCAKCGASRPAEEPAAHQAVQERERSSASSAEAEGNKGMLMKVAIGVAVLLVLIGAYFMFGRKKEAPPASEPPKAETKTETKAGTEKPMDLAAKAEKLKQCAEALKTANAQKKQFAATNEKLVFLVEDVRRTGNDLEITGHFYNGKKNRTIISVKSLELDIVLRDMDKEVPNEKNIKYEKSFTGMNIQPRKDSQLLTVNLPGKAPGGTEFNNFTVTVHDVHWEAVGK